MKRPVFCFMFSAHLELILMTVVCNYQKEFTSCKISPTYSSFLFRLITFKKQTTVHSVQDLCLWSDCTFFQCTRSFLCVSNFSNCLSPLDVQPIVF